MGVMKATAREAVAEVAGRLCPRCGRRAHPEWIRVHEVAVVGGEVAYIAEVECPHYDPSLHD